jgi:hypothetical protein
VCRIGWAVDWASSHDQSRDPVIARSRRWVRWALRRHPALFRARDLLLTRTGDPTEFWVEDANQWNQLVPEAYEQVAAELVGDGCEWDRAVHLAVTLNERAGRRRGLSVDSVRALEAVQGGAGTCSDRSQVFVGLCVAAGIRVREWAMRSDRHGHAFCEVYSPSHGRWLILDPSNAACVLDDSGAPVGVLEILESRRHHRHTTLAVEPLPGVADPSHGGSWKALDYLRGDVAYRLIARNCMFDQDCLLRFAERVPLVFLHAALLVTGRYQRYWSYEPDQVPEIVAHRPLVEAA